MYKRINDCLFKIKNSNLKDINEQFIIDCICEYGLVYDDRNLYEPYGDYMVDPNEETGLWQRPNQLANAILYILDLNINSYLEVGAYKCGTFLLMREFLKLKNPNLKSTAIDIKLHIRYDFIKYYGIDFQLKNTYKLKNQKFDLVFIDGDHSLQAVINDYENVGKCAKYCMFHDINDVYVKNTDGNNGGVPVFWNSIKKKSNFIEFIDDTNVMGIGILKN